MKLRALKEADKTFKIPDFFCYLHVVGCGFSYQGIKFIESGFPSHFLCGFGKVS